jgi:signal transduction histidine kinase
MRTLGDELISSEVVAVIELVKNAYDADARRVLVRFRPPLEVGNGGIDIIDDGHGMSVETVEGAWLEPATNFRRRNSKSESLERRVLGEKGIGRFAVSRLSNELEMVTRRGGQAQETSVLLDWSLFDDDDAYLDEIEIVIDQAAPYEFAVDGPVQQLWHEGSPKSSVLDHGTLLRMNSLRATWGEQQLVDLRNGLSRLVSPYLFEATRDRDVGFQIDLQIPGVPGLSGPVEPPETIRNSPYSMIAEVSADGSYEARLNVRDRPDEILKAGHLQGFVDRRPETGSFRFELRAWDRDRESIAAQASLTETKPSQVRKDLNESAGVSIYRDGFRVLPYGERGNDWLSLDSRRVNNPTMRLSNNQVVGFIFISGEDNPSLRDQTNREGLIDNQAFDDLRDEVGGLLALLEEARYGFRRPEAEEEPRRDGLFGGVNIEGIRAYASERYPDDRRLSELLGETQVSIDEGVERVQETVSRYRRLAALGELIDKVIHDGRAPLGKIGGDAELGLSDLAKANPDDHVVSAKRRLERILQQRDVLAAVFRRIEPFGGRKRGRPSKCDIEDVIKDSVAVLETDFAAIGAEIHLPESHTEVTVDESELQQVFVNLLRNSLYWLREVPKDRRAVEIDVQRDDDGLHIAFSDSGPGVPEEIRDRIFDPYFSTSQDGVGLGLSIAGEILGEFYDGTLALLDSGPLPGAAFLVTLRHRV